MQFNNDEATLSIDDLGYQKQARTIRNLILNAETPFSIGISGRWGSGKTSMMRHLMASIGGKPLKYQLNFKDDVTELEKEFSDITEEYCDNREGLPEVQAIWFNPWENEDHKEPMVALLQEIHTHFSLYAKTLDSSKKFLSVAIHGGLDALGSFFKLGKNPASNLKDIGEKYETESFQTIDRNQKFRYVFQDAIKTLLIQEADNKGLLEPSPSSRLVIFIDDLDRCEDETIAKLLKEIKQYLSTKHCVFVFGYDRQHIEKSLAHSESKSHKETRAYLEKLLQTTFYIKEPKPKKLATFIQGAIEKYQVVNEEDRDDLVAFLMEIIDPNPRRVKAFLTAYYFHILNSELYQVDNENTPQLIAKEALKKLALIAYLKLFYESVYTALENKHDMLHSIVKVCTLKDKVQIENAKEYFVYLEFLSHLHNLDIREFTDAENRNQVIENSPEKEQKFLNEVYQMQGKHKTFDHYRERFAQAFNPDDFELAALAQYL